MSFGEVEHFATMLAGCESINSGKPLNSDGRYAYAVLKLHAADFGAVAGQEGFLDSIKRGASNIKEWIIKVIRAIRDFLTGRGKKSFKKAGPVNSNKEDHERVKEVSEKIPGVEKAIENLKPQYEQIAERITNLDVEGLLNVQVDIRQVTDKMDELLALLKRTDANKEASKIESQISRAFGASRKELYKLLDGIDAKVKHATPDEERKLSSITVMSKDFTELHARIENVYDNFI